MGGSEGSDRTQDLCPKYASMTWLGTRHIMLARVACLFNLVKCLQDRTVSDSSLLSCNEFSLFYRKFPIGCS